MDVSQLKNFPLKVIFLIHFIFISMALLGGWSPMSYFFYNALLMALLLWSIIADHEEPLQMAVVINGLSIILDIFVLIFHFPHSSWDSVSAAMAILHLILRPFTCIYMIKDIQQRTGRAGPISGIGDIFPTSRDHNYEDIDRSQSPGHAHQGGYNFSTAQQI